MDASSSQNSGGMSSTYSELRLLKPRRTIHKLTAWLSECIANLRRASKQGSQLQLGPIHKLTAWLSECIANLRRASKQGSQLQLGPIHKLTAWLSECIANLRQASKQGSQLQLGALNSPSSSWVCVLPSRKILVLQLPNWSMALLFISQGTSFIRHNR